MSEGLPIRSFYRVAKHPVPREEDYRTQRSFRGEPPPGLSEEERWCWDAFSAFDSEAGARRQGKRIKPLGTFIVRYDIVAGSGVEWRKTFGPGHYSLKGTRVELHRCLADYTAKV